MLLATTVGQSLFDMGIPIAEKVIRTVIVYFAILLLLRIFGARTAAQLNSIDLVVLLLISNVVQNAIIGPDNSLAGGLVGALVLVVLATGIDRLVLKSNRLDEWFEGRKRQLVKEGRFVDRELRRLGIRSADLDVALRRQGADEVGMVRSADMYPTGAIVVDLDDVARDASRGDIERLETKLDALQATLDRLEHRGS
jgi:uncharacterized membrane protein YcaP (DUF421 family)